MSNPQDPTPHADRDASEQPVWPPQQRRDAQARADIRGLSDEVVRRMEGTSRPDAARAARAGGVVGAEPVRPSVFRAVADAVVAAGPDADEEYGPLLTRQGDLLTRTINALRGDPPELVHWSHHDVPEWASKVVAERDALLAEVAELRLGRAELADETHALRERVTRVPDRLQRAEAERDRLAEAVARVEALADEEWLNPANFMAPVANVLAALQGNLHAALSGPEPAPTTPETPQEPAGDAGSVSGQSGEAETQGGAEKPVWCICIAQGGSVYSSWCPVHDPRADR